jgi:glucose/arabinose dehydrogenase
MKYATRSLVLMIAAAACAQQAAPPLPEGPTNFTTQEYPIRVVTVAKGLANPWSIAFLPDGSMLVTERPGRLRIIRTERSIPSRCPGFRMYMRSASTV